MGQIQKQATTAGLVVVVRRRRLHKWGLGETLVDGVLVVLLCGIGSAQDGRMIAHQQHREIKIKLKAAKATRNRSDTDNQQADKAARSTPRFCAVGAVGRMPSASHDTSVTHATQHVPVVRKK